MTGSPQTGNASPRVVVIGTGGSISTPARHELDLHEYGEFSRPVEVDELLGRFASVLAGYELSTVRFRAIDSVMMDPRLWLQLHRCISETVQRDPRVAGVVVTHGTSSLEETAYFLHLTLKTAVPVVIVGAQRPPDAASSDVALNLLNALRVAHAPAARNSGVLVVMNGEVHCAREVTKAANFSLQAFRTPDLGALGSVEADGEVALYRSPRRRHAPDTEFDVTGLDVLPPVEIVYSYAGASGTPVAALLEEGCRGIVVAGMPPGRAAPAQDLELARAASRGVLVVQCSRAGSGRTLLRSSDRAKGYVGADNLNPQKARVLAMLALSRSDERAEIERMFAEY